MSHSERGVPIFPWPERCWDIFRRSFWFMKGIQKIDIWMWLFFWTRTAWWFGTWILFFHILGISSSQLTFIFFRGLGIPPAREMYDMSWHCQSTIHVPCRQNRLRSWRFLKPGRVKNRLGKPERFEIIWGLKYKSSFSGQRKRYIYIYLFTIVL